MAQRPDPRDERFTRVERDLMDGGFDFYMPVEVSDVVHHRTKKLVQKRAALIPGYVFVTGITNFWALSEIRTVAGVISGMDGRPLSMDGHEVDRIREAETAIFAELALDREKRFAKQDRMTQRRLERHFPRNAVVSVNTGFLSSERGKVVSVTGRQTVRIILDRLSNLGTIELGVRDVEMVEAAE